jgi:hypothetical protein
MLLALVVALAGSAEQRPACLRSSVDVRSKHKATAAVS